MVILILGFANILFRLNVLGMCIVNRVLLPISWFPTVQIQHCPLAVSALFAILAFTANRRAMRRLIQFAKYVRRVLLDTLNRPAAPLYPILLVSPARLALLENMLSLLACTRM